MLGWVGGLGSEQSAGGQKFHTQQQRFSSPDTWHSEIGYADILRQGTLDIVYVRQSERPIISIIPVYDLGYSVWQVDFETHGLKEDAIL